MKLGFLCFIISILSSARVFSQDLITTKTGKDIWGKVIKVTPKDITYTRSDSVITMPKSEIFMIKYPNGSKAFYGQKNVEKIEAAKAFIAQNYSHDSLAIMGSSDARKYYKSYSEAGTGTFIFTMLCPPAGLLIAATTSSSKPKVGKLNYPSDVLIIDPEYKKNYISTAHKVKKEHVWINFGAGLGFSAALIFIIIPEISRHKQ